MRIASSAPIQSSIINLLLGQNKPMSLREITNKSDLSYHQVASALTALKLKGYVTRIQYGLYEGTEDARLFELSPDVQIKILRQKVEELEGELKSLLTRLASK